MDRFYEALLSEKRNPALRKEDDWFRPLLGDWNFDYSEPGGRHVGGEWLFRRALDGMAIEDLFICPSRTERIWNPQSDAEYGAAIRMYDERNRRYDMTYVCADHTTRLTCTKEGDRIVCTSHASKRKWIFSDITSDSFHWENLIVAETGPTRLDCEVHATRKPPQSSF